MRRIGPACLCGAFLLALFVEPGSAARVTALQILDKSFDPESGRLEYELWNSSDKIITAWRLSLAHGDAHGHGAKSILDQDVSLRRESAAADPSAPPGRSESRGPIDPHQGLAADWLLDTGGEAAGFSALSLEVRAVVFEDLSHEGDSAAAEAILAARAARAAETGTLLAGLAAERHAGRSGQAWGAALKQRAQALRRLGESGDGEAGELREVAAAVSAVRVELAEWLEAAGGEMSLAADPEATIERVLSALEGEFERARVAAGLDLEALELSEVRGGGAR